MLAGPMLPCSHDRPLRSVVRALNKMPGGLKMLMTPPPSIVARSSVPAPRGDRPAAGHHETTSTGAAKPGAVEPSRHRPNPSSVMNVPEWDPTGMYAHSLKGVSAAASVPTASSSMAPGTSTSASEALGSGSSLRQSRPQSPRYSQQHGSSQGPQQAVTRDDRNVAPRHGPAASPSPSGSSSEHTRPLWHERSQRQQHTHAHDRMRVRVCNPARGPCVCVCASPCRAGPQCACAHRCNLG